MDDELTGQDFDFNIEEILIAHEYIFKTGFTLSDFSEGRGSCGVCLAMDGSCVYRSGEEVITLNEDQFAFFSPNTAYNASNDGPDDFHHYTVNFILKDLSDQQAGGKLSGLLALRLPLVAAVSNPASFINQFTQLVACWQDKRPGYRVKAKSILAAILFDFLTEFVCAAQNPDITDKVMPAKRYLDKYYIREVTLYDLAEMCGLSVTHFRRCFHSAFGISPIEYRTSLRISNAKDLLLCKYYKISEIAEMLGFADVSFFSRFFSKHTGMSPIAFRKLY